MSNKTLIRSEKIRGTVDNIRAALQKLSGWQSSGGAPFVINELGRPGHRRSIPFILDPVNPPTRGTWRVGIWERRDQSTQLIATATIEAYELQPSQTTIEFWDGNDETIKPIGPAFEEYCLAVLRELQPVVSDAATEQAKQLTANQEETQIQLPAPSNPSKTTKLTREQITFALLVGGFFVALFTCIAAWLVVRLLCAVCLPR
jgi:hypothetical protein